MMNNKANGKRYRRRRLQGCIPYVILILCAILLLVRAFLGFCASDEPFYFSTAYRFFRGDSLFLHDWFPTQLSGVILLPFMAPYIWITGSTAGILLYFRIWYVVLTLINALVFYNILKQHKPGSLSFMAAVCVLFYAHLNIATLSYYTVSVQCFLTAMLFIYHWEKLPMGNKKHLITAGILYAVSVLALPTMAVGYLLTVIPLLVLVIIEKKMPVNAFVATLRRAELADLLKYTFIGILIPAAVFLAFLFTNVYIGDFISNIRYVLSDEEHATSLIYPLRKFFISINEVYGIYAYLGYALTAVTFLGDVFTKKGPGPLQKKPLVYLVFFLDLLLFIAYFIKGFGHTGYVQTALCLFCLPLFFASEHKDWTAFFTFFVNGLLFSLCYSYSSNGYLYVLSMGHFIAGFGGMFFIWDFGRQLPGLVSAKTGKTTYGLNRFVTFLCTLAICAVMLETASLRIVNVYRDAPLTALTERIPDGPAKWLYTTPGHLKQYEEVSGVLAEYCRVDPEKPQDNMLFISKLLPWGYLCTDMRVGAPTTWRIEPGSERLEEYYSLNPDRIPSTVLILNKEYGCYDSCGDVEADPTPNLIEDTEGFLPEYMEENDYEVIPVICGTLYTRPQK